MGDEGRKLDTENDYLFHLLHFQVVVVGEELYFPEVFRVVSSNASW